MYVDWSISNKSGNFDGTSNTVVLHLVLDDTVDLGDCSETETIHTQWETAFSGYLLNA